MATHLREDMHPQAAADVCAAIADALEADPATQALAPLWIAQTEKGDAIAADRRKRERALGRARAILAVVDATWDDETGSFGRDVLNESGGRRDGRPYTRFFGKVSPSEAQDFGVDREVKLGRFWTDELNRDPSEVLAVKWLPRLGVANDKLEVASKGRVDALSALSVQGTTEMLYVEAINVEIDKLEGELKKIFPGPKNRERVASFLAATKPARKRGGGEEGDGEGEDK